MKPAHPILYSFRRCPYAMRARMALLTARIECELREVVLRDKPPEFVALSPKATVPVMQLADGSVLEESLEVMLWALRQNDPHAWLTDRADEDLALVRDCDLSFKPKLDRYKYHVRFPQRTQIEYRQCGEVFLAALEQRLTRHGDALTGPETSVADIGIFPFVRQFARVDWQWFSSAPYPRLLTWLVKHEESTLFSAVMRKYSAWRAGDTPVWFGPS
ncbi:MAG: glutathione S-transferase [Pseudomonadota bacterium]